MNNALWEALSAFLISVLGSGCTLIYARRAGVLDMPNHRSSHTVPTPRGGGIALVASALSVAGYGALRSVDVSWPILAVMGAAVATLAIVGWMDDRGSTRVALRLVVHASCGLAIALLVQEVSPVSFPLGIAW